MAFFTLAFVGALRGTSVQSDIPFGNADGERLLLDHCLPDGLGSFPAVILVHGGAWFRGDKAGGDTPAKPGNGYMVPLHESLTRAGIAWFSINYRLIPKHAFPAGAADVATAIRWVKAHAAEYRIDPQRIALAGESAGGHLVALAAVRADEATRVAAVVSFYAPFDLAGGRQPGAALRPGEAALFACESYDAETHRRVLAASPLSLVKPGLPPFLLVHGTADPRMPIEQSIRFQERLRAAGVPCELLKIEGGVHGMVRWGNSPVDWKAAVIEWLSQSLGTSRNPSSRP